MGGALPLRSLLAAVFGPPDRGCHGHPGSTVFIGRVLQLTRAAHLWVPWEPWEPFGWPQGPMAPPLLGGEMHSREARGVNIYPGVPW